MGTCWFQSSHRTKKPYEGVLPHTCWFLKSGYKHLNTHVHCADSCRKYLALLPSQQDWTAPTGWALHWQHCQKTYFQPNIKRLAKQAQICTKTVNRHALPCNKADYPITLKSRPHPLYIMPNLGKIEALITASKTYLQWHRHTREVFIRKTLSIGTPCLCDILLSDRGLFLLQIEECFTYLNKNKVLYIYSAFHSKISKNFIPIIYVPTPPLVR